MAAYSITQKNGFVMVEVVCAGDHYGLGLRSWMARQRAALDVWANWAVGLAEEGAIPLALAESLLDALESCAEAQLPTIIQWIRGAIKGR